jgi:phosphatidylglycerol lysyltransferase
MKKHLQNVGYLISITLFVLAVVVIYHKLRQYHYHDIVTEIQQTPLSFLLLATGLTFLNYLVLTGYDTLALRYIQAPLRYHQIAIASFIGYTFSMNATVIGGSAARYRIYSSLGISAANVARLIIFCAITFWLGFFTLGALSFILHPQHIPEAIHLPFLSIRPIGVIFSALVSAYLILIFFIKKPLKIRGWEFEIPTFRLTIGQILLSSIDWAIAAGVLYVLMPHSSGLTYLNFLGIFLLGQALGLLSAVPGGLGVFETVILLLMSNFGKPAALVGSLLLYRVIYYLLPLIVASILLGLNEFLSQKRLIKRLSRIFGKSSRLVIPHVFAFTTFVAGAVLLFSGTLPATKGRLALLRDFLPLPAIELSHFLGSVVGGALLVLARGLQRRINAAYHITVVLLTAGVVFSVFKGLDYEEAVILIVMLAAILPCRKEFYRRTSLLNQRFSAPWIVSIIAVAVCSLWLGLFSYKHVQYSHHLWWQFALNADAPRFLRATAAVVTVFLLYFLAKLQLPGKTDSPKNEAEAFERAYPIVQSCRKTYAWLALLGDKTFLFDESQQAFIMYAVQGRNWIALGDPIGPQDRWQDLIWNFRELCDRYNGWPVFYQIDKEHLDLYLDLDLSFLKLGEEARISLQEFSLSGAARSGLRHSRNKLQKQNYTFSIVYPREVPGLLPQLREVSDQWLNEKKTREKRFSLGCFKPDYLASTPVAVIQQNQRISAFANILIGADKEEISVDLMRFLPSSPEGIMDYLFTEIMLWAKTQDYTWFNFGMAPLSGIEDRSLAPFWSHAGAFIFRHGEHFYNFQGVRQYKEKFSPSWQPKYLAYPKGFMLPRILTNVAILISGGVEGIVSK